jgi:hypothetical protein
MTDLKVSVTASIGMQARHRIGNGFEFVDVEDFLRPTSDVASCARSELSFVTSCVTIR